MRTRRFQSSGYDDSAARKKAEFLELVRGIGKSRDVPQLPVLAATALGLTQQVVALMGAVQSDNLRIEIGGKFLSILYSSVYPRWSLNMPQK